MKIITLLFALLAFNETIAEMGRVSYQDDLVTMEKNNEHRKK